jgi:hypothetical protein
MEHVAHFGLGQYAARSIIVTWTDGEKLTKVLDSEKDANQLIVIKHPDTTSSFNSWSAERNGEKINVPRPFSLLTMISVSPATSTKLHQYNLTQRHS